MPDSDSVDTTSRSMSSASDKPLHSWSDERKSAMTAFEAHNESLMKLATTRLSFITTQTQQSKLHQDEWKAINQTMIKFVTLNGPEYSHLFPEQCDELTFDKYKLDREHFFMASERNLRNAAQQLERMNDALASGQGSTAKGDTTVGE